MVSNHENVREVAAQAVGGERMVVYAFVVYSHLLQCHQVDDWQITFDDLLKLPEVIHSLTRIVFDSRSFQQPVNLRALIVRCVRERYAYLEVVRPVETLHTDRRIEGITQEVRVEIEVAIRIDTLHIAAKILRAHGCFYAGAPQGLPQILG